jgi:hypothetical protein
VCFNTPLELSRRPGIRCDTRMQCHRGNFAWRIGYGQRLAYATWKPSAQRSDWPAISRALKSILHLSISYSLFAGCLRRQQSYSAGDSQNLFRSRIGRRSPGNNPPNLPTLELYRRALFPRHHETRQHCKTGHLDSITCPFNYARLYINLLSQVSGYKSSRFNWLETSGNSSWGSMSPKACKMGTFSNSVTLKICRIGKSDSSSTWRFLMMAIST